MRFLLDTNILIPLEDSQLPLEESLANFVRLANQHGHTLIYHPASVEDINEDTDIERRNQTLQRLKQYVCLDSRPDCFWNEGVVKRNDRADNEILYALSLNAAHALVTEDRGIHNKAKEKGLVDRVYTIQTAEDQLRRLYEKFSVELPNIEEIPLYQLTPLLNTDFFDSLRDGYAKFNQWFENKAQEGRRAWVTWESEGVLGGICIYAHQTDELVADSVVLNGEALKLSTFKVGNTSRGKKIGELFLKAAFRYAATNRLENIFIHGDVDQHHFLFAMLEDFGFCYVGSHPGGDGRDAVYVKSHPVNAPNDDLPPFEYSRQYFPHYLSGSDVCKYIIPIRPEYHRVLFPDYTSPSDCQLSLFTLSNTAGNAIKLAYLCHAPTKNISPGDIALFYRSRDDMAITSIGIVESYETLEESEDIVARVKRRTVYSMEEIDELAVKPTRVMLFRLIHHFDIPIQAGMLVQMGVFSRAPQSITKITDDKFQKIITRND